MILDLTNLTVDQLKLLNSIPKEIHIEFNKLTEEILNSSRKKTGALVSNIVSRHPYQSGLFDLCINLAFVDYYISKKDYNKIIVNDSDLFYLVKTKYPNINIKLINKTKKQNIVCKQFKGLMGLLFKTIIQILSKSRKRKERIIKTQLILLDTFMLEGSKREEKYINRYYTDISNFISKEDFKKIYFVPEILFYYSRKKLQNIINNSNENILIKHDFLKPLDYIKTLFNLYQTKFNITDDLKFKEFNISKVIKKQIKKEKYNSSAFIGLLNYFFIKRLKQEKIKVSCFIDWNENQPIDKGLIRGIHDFYQNICVKGYRAFLISYDYNLYLIPTKNEQNNGVIPDIILLTGKSMIKDFYQYMKQVQLNIAPAFRFNHLYSQTQKKKRKYILIVLPIGFNDSVSIIKRLLKIENKLLEENQYLIRKHPGLNEQKLLEKVSSNWNKNFVWAQGSFYENLSESKLFISNTSSAIMEALAFGVPGIILGAENGITQNPIPEGVNKEMWRIAYSINELSNSIIHFLEKTIKEEKRLKEIGDKIKENYFEPVTERGVRNFLNLN